METATINKNLIGQYTFKASKLEFKPTAKRQIKGSKPIFSIRFGDRIQNIWINFKDYSNYTTAYYLTKDGYTFVYNEIEYIIKNTAISYKYSIQVNE